MDTGNYTNDMERRYPILLRRANRHDLAQVARYIPTNSTLLSLKIVMDHGNVWNYHWRLASLSTSNALLDPLCAAIREATAHSKTPKNLALAG